MAWFRKNYIMRKKTMLATLFCVLSAGSSCLASGDDYDLYLLSSEGEYVSLGYSSLRSLSFAQVREDGKSVNKMIVNRVDGTSDEFNLLTYDAILFNSVATGIEDIAYAAAGETLMEMHNGEICCHASGLVKVFQIDGRMVKSALVESGDRLSVADLADGTYIFNLNGKSVKIQKK